MDEIKVELKIYSPRWGVEDGYDLTLARSNFVIKHGPREAKCVWKENLDPEWSGGNLISMLENDAVYPPSVLPKMFEHVWKSWRSYELDDSKVREEMEAVANWLNGISKSKPDSEFWRDFF